MYVCFDCQIAYDKNIKKFIYCIKRTMKTCFQKIINQQMSRNSVLLKES